LLELENVILRFLIDNEMS